MKLKNKRKKREDKNENNVNQKKKEKKKIKGQKQLVRQKFATIVALLLNLVKYSKICLNIYMENS